MHAPPRSCYGFLLMAHMHSLSRAPLNRESSDPIGLVLLNEELDPVYINTVAEEILCYPDLPASEVPLKKCAIRKLRTGVLAEFHESGRALSKLVSGKRLYLCRVFYLEPDNGDTNGSAAKLAVLLERISRRDEQLRRLLREYKLTPREQQAVRLLFDGLTTKEIAQKMNISPNTVKAFLHLIMIKVGVTTRAGIIGIVTGRVLAGEK